MHKSFLLVTLLSLPLFATTPAPLTTTWQKAFGGGKDDIAKAITATKDGGAIMISTTRSFGHGKTDINVMKLDSGGHKLWEKNFGGKRKERAAAITQTKDGNFVIVSTTKSYGKGGYDYYAIKLDSNGSLVWEQTAGGKDWDIPSAVVEMTMVICSW